MAQIISIHSFRGGTGKSNLAANIAGVLAAEGRRVGVVDADIQSPGIHVLLGLPGVEIKHALNDYLWGDCDVADVVYDVTQRVGAGLKGRLYLIPSSLRSGEITRVLREGYDVQLLTRGIRKLIDEQNLDVLLIDTHPGLNEETLLSMVIAHTLAIVLRPDAQDYEGTSVTAQVARELEVPQTTLVVNNVPSVLDSADVRARVEQIFGCPVAAVLPHTEELMALASGGVFALRFPGHPLSVMLRDLAARLAAPVLVPG